ncbi:MAG: 3-phosphoshikimate 1-carboxyvinyltransferase [Deltaproteobacteria bacterium]|nr:3-phosphoshikimate 1-carboxyvinyltransferase [Deltaproteobacteria bacterium]
MKSITVKKINSLKGEITVPGDKSISHRAIIFGAIAEGDTHVTGFLEGEDNLRTLQAFRQMGIQIDGPKNGRLIIYGKGLNGLKEPIDVIDAGNSGTTTRLLTGLLAGQKFFSVITGDEYLRKRPMKRVIVPLSKMGALIYGRDNNNLAPLSIIGRRLKAIDYISPIASAQVKSAILLTGLFADGTTSVTEPIKSRDHTERMLKAFGADINIKGLRIEIKGGSKLKPQEIDIPGDISSAAFFIVAGLITKGSEILIKNVGVNPTRTGIIDLLLKMGGDIKLLNKRESSGEPAADILVKSSKLKGIKITKKDIPRTIDEIPILCVASAFADGETKISGAEELRVKESDRIRTMADGLSRLGVDVEERADGMVIKGAKSQRVKESKKKIKVNSFGDHRVAMSMIIAGLAAHEETVVEDIKCIDTSFPGFLKLLKGLVF